MWMIVPIFSLVMIHLSGNNIAVIPDIVGSIGGQQAIVTILASIILGIMVTAMVAWIGVQTKEDVMIATKQQCGIIGKKIVGISLLAISVPASSLTGCYYTGEMVQILTGLPHWFTALACLTVFCFLAFDCHHELLILSNYIGLLLLPLLFSIIAVYDFHWYTVSLQWSKINWTLVFALLGYNVGGIWLAVVMETASYLSEKGNWAIVLVMIAKVVEGIITLCIAYVVLSTGAQGPLALIDAVSQKKEVAVIFNIVLLCTFLNTTTPAMLLNVKQMSRVTGLTACLSLAIVIVLVYAISFLPLNLILSFMGYAGLFMIVLILYSVYHLHKYGIKQKY